MSKAKNLAEFRKVVLERDNYICQQDGKKASIVHHIIPRSLDTDDGISLCLDCHALRHPEIENLILTPPTIHHNTRPWKKTKKMLQLARSYKEMPNIIYILAKILSWFGIRIIDTFWEDQRRKVIRKYEKKEKTHSIYG